MASSPSVRTRSRRSAGPTRRGAPSRRWWRDPTAAPSRRHTLGHASTGASTGASSAAWSLATGGRAGRSAARPLVAAELARLVVLVGLAAGAIGLVLPALLQAAAGSAH